MPKTTTNLSFLKVLNGMSIAIVVALIPSAMLGELSLFLGKEYPIFLNVYEISTFCTRMMPFLIGICVANQHNLDSIQSASVAFATTVGSGVITQFDAGVFSLAGTGDVINAGLVATLSTWVIIRFLSSLKSFAIIIIPTVIPIFIGGLGLLSLPYVSLITVSIGNVINQFTTLHPLLMGLFISMSFSVIVVSPISTVGIAYSIGISGISAAAANSGVAGTAITLAVFSYKANSLGVSLAHFIGTPKMQMANFVKKPIMLLPALIVTAIMGLITGFFQFTMSTQAAGFGISGAIGPLGLIEHLGWTKTAVVIAIAYYVILPTSLAFALLAFFKKSSLIKSSDYALEFK